MQQHSDKITSLLSGFLSGSLNATEKSLLYSYITDEEYKEEVIALLKTQWKEAPQVSDIPSDAMFAKIKQEIVAQSAVVPNVRKLSVPSKILRYAAIFILAFGISWAVQKISTKTTAPATAAIQLYYNEILVPYGSKTMVLLPDSTKVWLNSGARLKYPSHFNGDLRKVHLQGEGFFDVTKDHNRPFLVNSNGMNIKVHGTKFNIMANADDQVIEATLVEGAIEIVGLKDTNSNQQNNIVLEPGQKLTLHKEKENYQVQSIQEAGFSIPEEAMNPVTIKSANLLENANVALTTAWTENKLVFVKERFGDIKVKLERWYGVNIEIDNPDILDYRFTGTFEKETFEQAMTALSKAAACNFKIHKNEVVVTRK